MSSGRTPTMDLTPEAADILAVVVGLGKDGSRFKAGPAAGPVQSYTYTLHFDRKSAAAAKQTEKLCPVLCWLVTGLVT